MGERIEQPLEGVRPSELNQRHEVILEIGPGMLPYFLGSKKKREEGKIYIGVEKDADSSKMARKSIGRRGIENAHILQADAADLPLAESSVDKVILNNIFGDPKIKNGNLFLEEISRVLKDNGTVVITESVSPLLSEKIHGRFLPIFSDSGILKADDGWFENKGFRVESLSNEEKKITEYDNTSVISPKQFQLVLRKIKR